jgi:hypothetical protein
MRGRDATSVNLVRAETLVREQKYADAINEALGVLNRDEKARAPTGSPAPAIWRWDSSRTRTITY